MVKPNERKTRPETNPLQFDKHFTSPARLAIIASLASGEPRSFTELKEETGLADGNLHVQTRKLQEIGYIESQ